MQRQRHRRVIGLLVLTVTVLVGCGDTAPAAPASIAQTATAFSAALAASPRAPTVAAPSAVTSAASAVTGPTTAPTATRAPTTPAPTMPPPPATTPTPAATPTSSAPMRIVTVTTDESINMRGGPSTTADVLGFIPPGEDAVVLEENVMSPDGDPPWFKVIYAGTTGYIRSDLVGMARMGMARAGSAMATSASGTPAASAPAASAAMATTIRTTSPTPAGTAGTTTVTPTRSA